MTADRLDWSVARPLDCALWVRAVTGQHWHCIGIGERKLMNRQRKEQGLGHPRRSYVVLPQGETPLLAPSNLHEPDLGGES